MEHPLYRIDAGEEQSWGDGFLPPEDAYVSKQEMLQDLADLQPAGCT